MNLEEIIGLFDDSPSDSPKLSCSSIIPYLNRLQLWAQLVRRQQEEQILSIVPIPQEWLDDARSDFLGDSSLDSFLIQNNWSANDLDIHLSLPEALRLFSEYRFSPGLEEEFLSANGGHDQVIYSLLRVRDPALAQELWIRAEEGETSFSELATEYGEGPESSKKGLIGPVPLGSIEPPQLRSILRSLSVSRITPPTQIGDWIILVRLEQLTKSKFDDKMRSFLLQQQLDKFLDQRVRDLLAGNSVDPIEYNSPS